MNIGIYSPRVGFATSGGTETVVRELAKQLTARHEITLYTGSGDILPEVRRMDIDIVQVTLTRKEDEMNQRLTSLTPLLSAEIESVSMYRQARKTGVLEELASEDVVSTHYYLDNVLLSRTVDVPQLFHIPGIKQRSFRWRLMARTARPDCYLATSEDTKRRAEEWLNIEVDGIVYPAVDRDQFSPEATPAVTEDQPIVLFVGRLQRGKGVPDLLEAHSRLETDAVLYVVGNGPQESMLRERVAELGIEGDVRFTGAVEHEKIHRYFAACDVFCLPSYHEGFPVVNLEALAAGKPIVSTTIDAIAEQVENGVNGRLVPPRDTDQLREALDDTLGDPELMAEFGAASRERSEEFTWIRQARELERQFQLLVHNDE
jgi:glycosyltransferase involved in cell wall biosynthesis